MAAILLVLLTAALVIPATASAQATITGTVRDSSGALLPGVAVEASSPVLIERVRSATTDRAGQYSIVDLRPGTFTVTFKLAGFTTVTQDGIELTGSFVATVNAALSVGAIAEAIKVKIDSPLIDVQSTRQQTSMTAAIVSDVPTGRALVNLGVLIPGMTAIAARNQNDVGGTNNLQNIFLAIHGGRVTDQRTYVDGVTIRNIQSEGHATNFTPDIGSAREVTIDTGAQTAEEPLDGVRANYVPREGGDTLQGSMFVAGANSAFQGSNLTSDLKRRGLTAADTLKTTYDVNPTVGGPIVQGRLWFYSAARFQSNQNYVAGVFENKNAGNAAAWTYVPDFTRQGIFAITQRSVNTRVTWQPAARHKISAFFEKQSRLWDEGNVNRSPEAFSRFRFPLNQIGMIGWSSPLSPRLFVEARAAYHAETWRNIGADDLFPNNRALIPVLEQGGTYPGLMYRAKNGVYAEQSTPFIKIGHASAAYVTGAHLFKAGFDVLSATDTNTNTFNDSALQYRFNDGMPNQLTEFATPYGLAWTLNETGLFAQDKWTLGRVTLNAGLRFDYFGTAFPEETLGPGTLTPNRNLTFPKTSWYGFKDLSPRFGVAYDPFGDGRTAIRASAGRYLVAISPATGNPITNLPVSVSRTWNDDNRDFVPDCDLLNPRQNGECGTISDLNFGSATPSVRFDPAILRGWNVRPVNWEFSAGVERELLPRVAVDVAYFRRVYGNFTVQDNLATTAANYTPFTVVAPRDPRLPGGGGYVVGGLYDLNPDKRGQVDNYVTSSDRYGRQIEHWNGVDAAIDLRLNGAMLRGGLSTGRTSIDLCEVAAQVPEILGTVGAIGTRSTPWSLDQCHVDTKFLTQIKLMGTYAIPRIDVQLAGTFQSALGPEIQANYVAPSAAAEPSLGRPLSGGANATVTLIDPGSVYGDRLNQLDIRLSKLLRFGRARTTLNVDVYNALNASPVTAVNLNYSGTGVAWLQPQGTLPARLLKLSVQFDY